MGPSDVPYQGGPKARQIGLNERSMSPAGNQYLSVKPDDWVFGIGPLYSGHRKDDIVLGLRRSEPWRRL